MRARTGLSSLSSTLLPGHPLQVDRELSGAILSLHELFMLRGVYTSFSQTLSTDLPL